MWTLLLACTQKPPATSNPTSPTSPTSPTDTGSPSDTGSTPGTTPAGVQVWRGEPGWRLGSSIAAGLDEQGVPWLAVTGEGTYGGYTERSAGIETSVLWAGRQPGPATLQVSSDRDEEGRFFGASVVPFPGLATPIFGLFLANEDPQILDSFVYPDGISSVYPLPEPVPLRGEPCDLDVDGVPEICSEYYIYYNISEEGGVWTREVFSVFATAVGPPADLLGDEALEIPWNRAGSLFLVSGISPGMDHDAEAVSSLAIRNVNANSAMPGDVNDDGVLDLVIGNSYTDGVHVFFGPLSEGELDVSDANVVIAPGEQSADCGVGLAVHPGGRLFVTCSGGNSKGAGYLAVFDGPSLAPYQTTRDAQQVWGDTTPKYGSHLEGRYDLTGDGILDLVVSSPEDNDGAGAVWVLPGPL